MYAHAFAKASGSDPISFPEAAILLVSDRDARSAGQSNADSGNEIGSDH